MTTPSWNKTVVSECEIEVIGRADYDLHCEDCGRAHYFDCSLPSEIWNQIAEPHNVLCPLCIDKRLVEKGLRAEAEFYYVGDALVSRLYNDQRRRKYAAAWYKQKQNDPNWVERRRANARRWRERKRAERVRETEEKAGGE